MPRIKVGQAARIKVLALRKEPFEAEVRMLVPFVSSIREQDRTSQIELTLKSKELLPVGASADVEIIVDRKDQVLAVPIRSISSSAGKRFVYRLENGKAKKVEISIGIDSFELAEVLTGLGEGDTVLIPSESNELSDGLTVRLE
jgi:HlyD family secretion protein